MTIHLLLSMTLFAASKFSRSPLYNIINAFQEGGFLYIRINSSENA